LAKYQDNLGKEKQVEAKRSGQAIAITQTISTQGVTKEAQAQRVAQVALNSIIYQDRTCQLETDIDNGLYVRQGDIVRSQHTIIENEWENNGFVLAVDDEGVTLSESVTIGPRTRITIGHRESRITDEALLIQPATTPGKYLITGLSEPIQAGDIWIIGEVGTENRLWRVTGIQSDVETNTVKLTCLRWDDRVLD
jgi:hypothetical protein